MFQPARLKSAMVASWRLPLGMPSLSLFAIIGLRVLVAESDRAGETTPRAFVANQSVTFHFHAKQQRVVVAIRGCGDDAQAVAAGFPFHPELLAGAAPKGNEAGFQRLLITGWIEKAQHQHFARARILHDAGSKSIHLVEVDHLFPGLEYGIWLRRKSPPAFMPAGLVFPGLSGRLLQAVAVRRHGMSMMVVMAVMVAEPH